jgi:methyl-accepting chemotaxis protein
MLQLIDRLGLKRALYFAFAATLISFVGLTYVVVTLVVRTELEDVAQRHAQSEARRIAAQVAGPLAAGKDDVIAGEIASAPREQDDAYLVVLRADRSVVARVAAPAYGDRIESVLAEQSRHPERSFFQRDGVYAFLEPARAEAVAQPKRPGTQATASPLAGYVLYGKATAQLDTRLAHVQLVSVALLLCTGLVLAGALGWFTHRVVVRPLTDMSLVAGRVAEYDLGARAPKLADDELGRLADSLNRIGENLTSTLSRMGGVSEGVGQVIERMTATGSHLADYTGTVSARVAETGVSMSDMLASLKGIADSVEVLAQSADESSSSIIEMAATNDAVAESIQALAASVAETTSAIEEMTQSTKEVAKNIEDLAATAQETSASMNQMDVSISQVETNANETAKLSEQALKDAELSTEALSRTLAGIERIKDSSKEAASVIDSLGRKIGTIGNILNVIDEVAEQTNLLALNAAILAAQSGEHGKGFAVVADEIKDLAERTGASTKEIAELIRSVQDESANAVSAMDRGVKNVEEGVRLGQEAETALKKIQVSSVKSTQMVKAIARATIEQARGSKHVTTAINRIAETVSQIATSTGEQARGSEQIMKSSEKMKVITTHVERSSREQAHGSKQITKAIESIGEMVKQLNRAQKDQTHGSERVMGALEQIKRVAEAQTSSVGDLESAIGDLTQRAGVLRQEVKRFKV